MTVDSAVILKLTDLMCVRGEKLLFRDLNYSLGSGELLHITGRNGSGKTSLLRLLSGFLKPFSGSVVWHESAQLIYVGHQSAVKNELTVAENLRYQFFILDHYLKQGMDVVDQLGLTELLHVPGHYLSQGQKQKITLLRLWLLPATVWLLDEPFTALDAQSIELLELLCLEKLQKGLSIIMTTHRPLVHDDFSPFVKPLELTLC